MADIDLEEILGSVLHCVLHNHTCSVLETFNSVYAANKHYFPVVAKAGGPLPFLMYYCDFLKVIKQPHGKSTIQLSMPVVLCTVEACKCQQLHVCEHWPSRPSTCLLCRQDIRSLSSNKYLINKYPVLKMLDNNTLKKLIHYIKGRSESPSYSPTTTESPDGGSVMFPGLCEHYNGGTGCVRNMKCHFFHLCRRFVYGRCEETADCSMSHDLYSTHNQKVLQSEGEAYLTEDAILSILRTERPMTTLALDIGVREVSTREEDTQICVWYLIGQCEKQTALGSCDKHHTNLPFWWQYEVESGEWEDFGIHDIIHLEQAYCDTPTCHVKAHINNIEVIIEFPAMVLQDGGYKVRRLSTGPSQGEQYMGKLSTTYHWYWEDDEDLWHEFPSCVTQGKSCTQLELPSHVIEGSYLNKDDSLKFTIADSKFVLLFGGMQMKEIGCTTVRRICRRPIFKSLADCASVMCKSGSLEYSHTLTEPSPEEWLNVLSLLSSDRVPTKILKLECDLLSQRLALNEKETKLLFHPIPPCGVGCVAQQGLTFTDTPQHMKKYGSGVHVTTNEDYALHFSTTNAVLLVETVIGSYARGKPTDNSPPVKTDGSYFDCCVNDVKKAEIFVIYKTNHLLPRYYIEFSNVKREQ